MKYQKKKKEVKNERKEEEKLKKMFGKFVKKNCQKLNFHILELMIIQK